MRVCEVLENKKRYLDLLLLADEQEDMIDRYLDRGRMFVLEDAGVKAECVVTKEKEGIYEIKNLAVSPEFQRSGCGRFLIEELYRIFPDCETLYVGTGETPATLTFYEKCGFQVSHRVRNFFTDHYRHPIYDQGILLKDMVYLRRDREENKWDCTHGKS